MKVNTIKQISLESVKKMAEAAEKKASEMNVPVVFTAVDAGGNLMLLHRMENAFITSIDIATNKAFTALALKIPTNEVTPNIQPGASLYGLQLSNNCRIATFGGGFPIVVDGEIIGAVGVSGGTVEEDMEIAKYALEACK
ncbi:heme-binding protein [Clostridium sporogenes]|uniref:Heme-binding protein n=2 Tax=Clostridium TaxID=1485 RepID=A0A6M0SY68_CLOBO|nr:heme-binding protein [Clostridium sporogenes]NFA60204.1 heme-binding protein [Clostridium botulinum]NFI72821.1 heme-binding protein [Clostridium sporogenes]NFL72392.1 heme-binding protein [Clostridium sporogenes]NFM23405.1 heme-binding protein [Clostridium sporogenes]NFP60234.1 heme-binding protein [Clostridium sporogenes]